MLSRTCEAEVQHTPALNALVQTLKLGRRDEEGAMLWQRNRRKVHCGLALPQALPCLLHSASSATFHLTISNSYHTL